MRKGTLCTMYIEMELNLLVITILNYTSRGSLSRMSALGAEGGANASSLRCPWEGNSPFLVYKAKVVRLYYRDSSFEYFIFNKVN